MTAGEDSARYIISEVVGGCVCYRGFRFISMLFTIIKLLPDFQVFYGGKSGIVLSPAELICCPDGCNSVDALTGPVNHHSTESRTHNDAGLKAISNLPAFISNAPLLSVSSRL